MCIRDRHHGANRRIGALEGDLARERHLLDTTDIPPQIASRARAGRRCQNDVAALVARRWTENNLVRAGSFRPREQGDLTAGIDRNARQKEITCPIAAKRTDTVRQDHGAHWSTVRGRHPVSYTHLDVYKRQSFPGERPLDTER